MHQGGIYPSSHSYRDRLSLEREDTFLYNSASSRSRPCTGEEWIQGQNSGRYSWKSSGFDSNTIPAVYTHTTFKTGYYVDGQPIEQQHPITAQRFKQKHPVDYMTQIRPDTETTSQAMRMLGTYESDKAHADRLGVFVPSGCPGGRSYFHADVRTGGFGLMPTLPRRGMGQTLTDGRNLK